MGPCLDDDTITALLERRLPAGEMRRVDGHLDGCDACRALVATLADDVSCARLSEIPEVLEETRPDEAGMPPAVMRRIGTVLQGKWTLETVLGVGGMAAVYKGRHRIGRIDAIKIVHRELAADAEVCARFEREARAVNRLNHPGAVAIRDIDRTDDGSPFMVMEFLDGEPLSVAATEGVATEQVLEMASAVLSVLMDAHALGVIHRDIKPANVFMLRDGGVKLLDFGLARLRGLGERSVYTQAGQTLGTLAYMPPEQLKGEGVDHRADLYALAATMFRVLSGRHVHAGATSAADALVRIATEPAPSLADVAPEIPLDVCRVVDRALAFRQGDRYPDAETMRDDVLALIAGDEPSFALSWSDDPDPEAEARKLVGHHVGDYELTKLIACGGMGGVYAARRGTERVAVKVILGNVLDRGGDARARFRREIRAASKIQSPYVVELIDAGIDEGKGLPFYAMELIDGRDLSAWLEEAAPLDQQVVARIFVQVCRGLRAAHEMGIVHRDIKPANIMLTSDANGQLQVKICDFGLAKTIAGKDTDKSQSLTHSGGILGTPRYAAPEQATHAKGVDARADIWGLCLSMHEALSGRKPWASCETLGALIVAICTQDAPSLREVAPWVDARVADLVREGLVRDVDQRTLTLDRLESELATIAGDGDLTEAMLQPVRNRQPADVDDSSEDATVAISADQTVAPTVAPAAERRGLTVWAAGLAAVVAAGVGWFVWRAGGPAEDVSSAASVEVSTPTTAEATASAPTASVTATPVPAPSASAPAPGHVPSVVASAPQPPASVRHGVPAKPAVPTRKPPSKPGGLDFHKTW